MERMFYGEGAVSNASRDAPSMGAGFMLLQFRRMRASGSRWAATAYGCR
jgi:hypothetical protein